MNHSRSTEPEAERYIPSLDGLRAISIVLVIYGHLCGCHGFWAGVTPRVACLARYGVQIFFVISGFLITTLLLKESDISLKRFYFRRSFRILPPFYAYLLLISLAGIGFHWVQLAPADLGKASLFISNYRNGSSWVVGHIWSLSTEEQFYLVWPLLMILCRKRYAIIPAAVVALYAFITFGVTHTYPPAHGWKIWDIFAGGMNGIAAGCILAFVKNRLHVNRYVAWGGIALVPLAIWFSYSVKIYVLFDRFSTFGIALFIAWAIDNAKTSLTGAFLNCAPMKWLGVISYSLYLWQMPFLDRSATNAMVRFPLNLILSFAFACLSYYGLETPCRRLRKRIELRMAGTTHMNHIELQRQEMLVE